MIIQIRESEIDFWKEKLNMEMMSLRHSMKMYPPRVKVTVVAKNRAYVVQVLPVKIIGCSRDGQLDMDLTIGNTVPSCPLLITNKSASYILFAYYRPSINKSVLTIIWFI